MPHDTPRSTLELVRRRSAPDPAPRPALLPPPDRGRLLYVSDVIALLRGQASSWWVRHRFAPELKIKIGGKCAWWEYEAIAWLDAGGTAPRAAAGGERHP